MSDITVEKLINLFEEEILTDLDYDEVTVKDKCAELGKIRQRWAHRLQKYRWKERTLNEKKQEIIDKKMEDARLPVGMTMPKKKDYFESSKEVIEINKKIQECNHIIQYLEDVMKNIYSVGYDIKNFIEMIKMENI